MEGGEEGREKIDGKRGGMDRGVAAERVQEVGRGVLIGAPLHMKVPG